MTLIDSLFAQASRVWREPRASAADILQLGVPSTALMPALLLVVVISVIFDTLLSIVMIGPDQTSAPFRLALIYMVIVALFSVVLTGVGRMFGGNGTFPNALMLAIFLQALLVPASAIQLVLAIISPQLAFLFIFVVAAVFIWLQVNFVAALHGFEKLGRAFMALLIASFIVALATLPFLAPEMPVPADV